MAVLLKITCAVVLLSEMSLAQSGPLVCDSTAQFLHRNMVDYTVKVRTLRGKVVDVQGVGIPRACLALFNSDHSKLLRTFESGDNGEFIPKDIKNGDYWLVVRDPQNAFCPASTRLKLRSMSSKSKLVINMRPAGIDSCSFCEAK
jgi:hypothetical protein